MSNHTEHLWNTHTKCLLALRCIVSNHTEHTLTKCLLPLRCSFGGVEPKQEGIYLIALKYSSSNYTVMDKQTLGKGVLQVFGGFDPL